MKKVLIATVLTLSLTSVAQAERAFGDIYKQCGIGAMIFDKNATAAAISNIIWDLGTTAISSNASSKENCNNNRVAAAAFINHTYVTLEQDIAKGEGEHISALMDIMGCNATSRASVVNKIRADFSTKVSAEGYSDSTHLEKAESLFNTMNAKSIVASCRA